MDILVTLDEAYLCPLRVMLTSLLLNHPGERFEVYLLHSGIPEEPLGRLGEGLRALGGRLTPIWVDEKLFQNAPITRKYPQEMYYRLLAGQLLPQSLERVLYLDPDILIINSLLPLWELEMGGYLFAAASHTGKTELKNSVNRIRLGTERDYFNSGVLLINLRECRERIHPQEIFDFVQAHAGELLLPDQDVLNELYSESILEVDDFLWNYDARNFSSYLLRSGGSFGFEQMLRQTAVLHFCGRDKPWKGRSAQPLHILYRHYLQLAGRYLPA